MDGIHLDTDLGGDIDDICALAMLLRWPDVDLTGITVVGDTKGRRAGYVCYTLGIEGRNNIPVAAGADISQGFYRYELGLPPEGRYWPEPNEGIEIEEIPLILEEKDGWLTERIDPSGRPIRVVTKVDGPRFSEFWLDRIKNY